MDSEEENHEHRSPQLRRRRKKERDAEAADRELAERLQREENSAAAEKRTALGPRRATSQGAVYTAVAKRRRKNTLREEQDDEFQRGLLADQIKDIDRRAAEEQETREKEEREDAKLLEETKGASVMDDARDLMKKSGYEPRIGSDGATCLRFALPTGEKVDRRFCSIADTVKTLRAFLLLRFEERGVAIKNVGLSTHFPKRVFLEVDDNLTLEEAGLTPRALLMVINMDS